MDAPDRRPAPRRPVLVLLGSDDASVAVLADALALAGAVLPGDDDAAAMVALNEGVLQRSGAEWTGVLGPRPRASGPAVVHDAADVAQARSLLSRLGAGATPVIADPRIAGVSGLWDEALRAEGLEPAYALVLRDVQGVAADLRGRATPSRPRAHLLWTRRMLAAEAASRGGRRVVVSLCALVDDPAGELDRIERGLEVRLPDRSWSAAAALERRLGGIDPGAARPAAAGLGRELAPVAALWSHLAAAAQDAPENEDTPARTAAWFEDQARLLAPLLQDALGPDLRPTAQAGVEPATSDALRARAEQAEARIDALMRERDLAPDRLREAQEGTRTAASRIEVLESALAVARRRAVETEATLQSRAGEADAERREARRALAAEQEAAHVAQAQAEEALRAARRDAEMEQSGRETAFARDRERFAEEDAALRERLALAVVELDAARVHARSLSARLEEAAARRARPGLRAWLARRLTDS